MLFYTFILAHFEYDYTSTYKELLGKAKIPLMYTSWLRRLASLVEKCIKGICPVYLNDF